MFGRIGAMGRDKERPEDREGHGKDRMRELDIAHGDEQLGGGAGLTVDFRGGVVHNAKGRLSEQVW